MRVNGDCKFPVETTVYLHPNARGKGIGTLLYQELIRKLAELDLHLVIFLCQ